MGKSGSSGSITGLAAGSEARLLEAVAKRDRAAFSELYGIYQPRLYGYLQRLVSNPVLVEEIIDDVMFVVWTDARKFRGQSAVSSWIFGIAYRKALSALRKEGRYEAPLVRDVETEARPTTNAADMELIRAGLEALSPDHRQVIELAYFCGFSYQEIADIAECPVNTVKTRMFHARKRLGDLLPRLGLHRHEEERP